MSEKIPPELEEVLEENTVSAFEQDYHALREEIGSLFNAFAKKYFGETIDEIRTISINIEQEFARVGLNEFSCPFRINIALEAIPKEDEDDTRLQRI